VHFYRNVFSHVPSTRVREVSHMLKAIHVFRHGIRTPLFGVIGIQSGPRH
jgi:hypothetical protein